MAAVLKITGGELRGRRFQAPKGRGTRPTSEKVREAIFNTLNGLVELPGADVLDLFAGSGALGIEALSRGAAHVIFVESHARTAAGVRKNLRQLGVTEERWQVAANRVEGWLHSADLPATPLVVLADPPYATGDAGQILAALAASSGLADKSIIALEAASRLPLDVPPGLELLRVKRYGDTQVLYLMKTGNSTE